MDKKDYINTVYRLLNDSNYKNTEINYILAGRDSVNGDKIIAAATDRNDPDLGVEVIVIGDVSQVSKIQEWQYNIDDDIFSLLEDGFKIVYMPLYQHYNIWCALDTWRDDIIHTKGMQNYLSYCFTNGITPKAIEALGLEKVDVMDLYEEMNGNYKIIAEMSIGSEAIVLAYNPKNPSPYVTWSTASDRHWGYTAGHYHGSFTLAYKDFESRCRGMFESSIQRKRLHAKIRKENEHER